MDKASQGTAETTVRSQLGNTQVTQAQYDALVSYVYNVGAHGAIRALDAVRQGRNADAAASIQANVFATRHQPNGQPVRDAHGHPEMVRLRGLVHRRQHEAAPFLPQNNGNQIPGNPGHPTAPTGGGGRR